MLYMLFKFVIGVVILLVSTEFFVRSAKKISQAFKISSFVLGTTLVAIGTSLPELAVSTAAAIKGDAGLAFGNIVGSNIVNILMVFATGIVIGKLRIGTAKTQKSAALMVGVTLLFIYLVLFSGLPLVVIGLILLGLAIATTILEYNWAVLGRTHEDVKQFKGVRRQRFGFIDLLQLILAPIGIIFGGLWVVSAIENISVLTGYSTTILGLSVSAIATSLPELFTTIICEEEKQEKITLGSILGSNIYNLLLIGGLVLVLSQRAAVTYTDSAWLIVTALLYFGVINHYTGKIVPRKVGVILFTLLAAYLLFLGYF